MQVGRGDVDEGGVVITIDGELDLSNASELRDALAAAVDDQSNDVWVDFAACTFIDSTGLRVIVESARQAANGYARLGIRGLRDQPKQLFELTMLNRSELLRIEPGPA
jgi:anti-sigma B factor antagonist